MKRMMLVDGSNQAYRAFFSLAPAMHAPDGFPTKALHGFTTMLAMLERDLKPDYVAVCFDRGLTFRHTWFADYKGHRPDMPDELRMQWPLFDDLCEGFGFRVITLDGFEADDVIGTLSRRYGGPDLEVYLVTGDKDYYQLVNDHVRVLDLMKDEEIGPAGVLERMGVPPERITDLRGLAGDPSDNIPGVPGIGDKTAAKLIADFGDLESILAAPIKGKRGESLKEFAETARLSKRLATIFTEVPLDLTLEDLAPRGLDDAKLRPLFERWNFGKIARRLLRTGPEVDTSVFRTVQDPAAWAQVLEALRGPGPIAIDIQGSSTDPLRAEIVGVSLAWSPRDAVYVPLLHGQGDQLSADSVLTDLRPILQDPSVAKVGADLKYDRVVLRRAGIEIAGVVGDTMLLDYLLAAHERSHGLETLAERYLSHKMTVYQESGDGQARMFGALPIPDATHYAAEAALVTWQVHDRLVGRMDEGTRHVYEVIELPLVPVLADMESAGILLDVKRLAAGRDSVAARVEAAERACHDALGRRFNVGSVPELRTILFEELGYEATKKTKTGYSTDSSVLEKLVGQRDPDVPALILEWRELSKLLSTYLDKLPEYLSPVDGRIHTSFNQAVAATGRLSSVDPNLQNIPVRTEEGRRIREAFVPAPGFTFLSCDYSQVELRILAHVSQSKTLVDAFASGDDIHRRTASEVFRVPVGEVTSSLRNAAKAINYGLLYGMSAFRLGRDLGLTQAEAKRYMDEYFARMPEVDAFIQATRARAHKEGHVTTLFGRRRTLPMISAKNFNERAAAEREAVNTVIQGTAADVMKLAMLEVHRRLRAEGLQARMLLQVHDELLLEVPFGEVDTVRTLVVEAMAGAATFAVPLEVNAATGMTWREAHG